MVFCWKCKLCGETEESLTRNEVTCKNGHPMIRDYRREAAGVQVFTSALGEGKVQTRVVKPEDNVPRKGEIIGE